MHIADTTILNYALTLEHLEANFYETALSKFSEHDFEKAGLPKWARGRFEQIATHEKAHVDFLSAAIGAAGGVPVLACEYSL